MRNTSTCEHPGSTAYNLHRASLSLPRYLSTVDFCVYAELRNVFLKIPLLLTELMQCLRRYDMKENG